MREQGTEGTENREQGTEDTPPPEYLNTQRPKPKTYTRLLLACLLLAAGALAFAVPLHCAIMAGAVGGTALVDGALFGLSLAAVTRTRRTGWIYFFLLCAGLTLTPLYLDWPAADSNDLTLWRGAPDLLENYFVMLRLALFLFALPYPFARFGRHAPD